MRNYRMPSESEDEPVISIGMTRKAWGMLLYELEQCRAPLVYYNPEDPNAMRNEAFVVIRRSVSKVAGMMFNATDDEWLQGHLLDIDNVLRDNE